MKFLFLARSSSKCHHSSATAIPAPRKKANFAPLWLATLIKLLNERHLGVTDSHLPNKLSCPEKLSTVGPDNLP